MTDQNEYTNLLNARTKDLSSSNYSYKLAGGQFAIDVPFDRADIDEKRMSVVIVFADGNRRDGVGDLTEVSGIVTERHRKNPIVLFDHAKNVSLPVGLAEDPDTKEYTVSIDPDLRIAKGNAFFYQGTKDLTDSTGRLVQPQDQHALFCEQLFHLIAQGIVRAGSFAYSVIQAVRLSPEYETGTPGGLHLLKTLLLEFGPTVLPASQDTVRKMKEYPLVCGKKLHPVLVKSFEPFAEIQTKIVTGYEKSMEGKVSKEEASQVLKDDPQIPPAKWNPGVGTVKSQPDDINEHRRKVPYLQGAGLASPILPTAGRWVQDTGVVNSRTKELRKKYRNVKFCRMRRRKSMPGSSFIYVDRKSIKAVQHIATAKGLKFEYVGPSKSLPTIDKVRLTGDDAVIDEIAREHGKSIRRGFKSMATKKIKTLKPLAKTGKKSMQDEEEKKLEKADDKPEIEAGDAKLPDVDEDPATGEPEDNRVEEAPEKYSAQVLRTMHKDAQILMQQYDEMRAPLEHEEVDKLLETKLQDLEEDLIEIESLFDKHHADLPKLEGVGADDKGMAEEEVEDEDTGDEATEADSEQEELPDAYEAVEGMDKKKTKALRTKYTKDLKKKCSACKSMPCKCMKSAKKKSIEVDKPDDTAEENNPVVDKVDPGDDGPQKSDRFAVHEKKAIGEAAGFMNEVSKEQNFGDEHRMKAYHWHKSLEPLHAQAAEGTNPDTQPGNEEFQQKPDMSKGYDDPSGAQVTGPTDNEHGSLEIAEKRKTIGKASMFLKSLSAERAFGDAHRQEADWHAKALNPIATEAEQEGVQEGDVATGEMGEKDMEEDDMDEEGQKSLTTLFTAQGNKINQLTKNLEALQKRFVR